MRFTAAQRIAPGEGAGRVDELTRHIGRLLRHPAYRRGRVVSAMLLRHLPAEAGYAWRGEDSLRERLGRAALDVERLDHLICNARAELARLRGPDL